VPSASRIVSGSGHSLKLWNPESGELLRTLEGDAGAVDACAFSPGGDLVVSASGHGTLTFWGAGGGEVLRSLEADADRGFAFSPDGSRIVTAGLGRLKLWDARSGDELRALVKVDWPTDGDWINACEFTADGTRILSAGERTLEVWEAESGDELRALEGHTDKVNDCAVSPDGRFAVSVSDDWTLRVWDLAAGRELATLPLPGEGQSVAFHPSLPRAACGDAIGSLCMVELVGIADGGSS